MIAGKGNNIETGFLDSRGYFGIPGDLLTLRPGSPTGEIYLQLAESHISSIDHSANMLKY